jgi:hypothetical protein
VEYQCTVQKLARGGYWRMVQKLCAVEYPKTVRWVLAHDIKVVHASYWCDREVIHNGFKVPEA